MAKGSAAPTWRGCSSSASPRNTTVTATACTRARVPRASLEALSRHSARVPDTAHASPWCCRWRATWVRRRRRGVGSSAWTDPPPPFRRATRPSRAERPPSDAEALAEAARYLGAGLVEALEPAVERLALDVAET